MKSEKSSIINAYFQKMKRVPFDELPTNLMTGRATFEEGTVIDTETVFRNVPIYVIPGFVRGKRKEITIPYPGQPYVVLSAKRGKEIRGIVKNLDVVVEESKTNDGVFRHQVSLDIALSDKVVNVMLFSNMMKISGAFNERHIMEAFIYIKSLMYYIESQGVKILNKKLLLVKLDVDMENVTFDIGFSIKRDALLNAIAHAELVSPNDDQAVRILYPMGVKKAKGNGERFFDFRIRNTGKVVFSGNNRKSMAPYYEKFMNFIEEHEAEIRFV